MKRSLVLFLLTTLFLTVSTIFAEEQFDPAARAKVIAPFIDEQTFAIVRIDLARVIIDPLTGIVSLLIPEEKENILQENPKTKQNIDSLLRAGVKDIYIGYRVDLLSAPSKTVFLIMPISTQFDQQAIENNSLFKGFNFKRAGDVLIGGWEKQEKRMAKIIPAPRPELATAFEAAGDTAIQVLLIPPKYFKRVIEETMPQLPEKIGGGPSSIVTQGCLWAALGVDFKPQITIQLVVQSQDAAAAAALNKKWAEVLQNSDRLLDIQKVASKFSEAVDVLMPKVEGDRIVLVIDEKQKVIRSLIDNSLAPAIQQSRDSARRAASIYILKHIGLAMHNYHDANKHLPAAASYSPDGKPLLSWRVMLLPMLEQNKLYDQFRLDEPWDSPNNRKLIDKMPAEYRSPKSRLKEPGKTNYVVPVGPGTMFEGREGINISRVKDGTAHTIMAVEVDDAQAVIWTKPDDLPYDPKEPARGLGGLYKDFFCAVFCDGAVRVIKLPCPDDNLRAAFSAAAEDPTPDFD